MRKKKNNISDQIYLATSNFCFVEYAIGYQINVNDDLNSIKEARAMPFWQLSPLGL